MNITSTPDAPKQNTRGVVFVHSVPSALCAHVEWAIASVLGGEVDLAWSQQPVEPGTYRAELSWQGAVGSGASITSAMRGWQRIRFEVVEEPTAQTEGARFSYVPELGVFHAVVGVHGDVMVPEERLKAMATKVARGEAEWLEAMDAMLGLAWDSALEPFRHAGAETSVRWLHQVV
jgi:hypothetical protein